MIVERAAWTGHQARGRVPVTTAPAGMTAPAGTVALVTMAPAPMIAPAPIFEFATTAPWPTETLSPRVEPTPPKITAWASARRFWPMVSVPPRGAWIVTFDPACAIEPMVIGWPSSPRIERWAPMFWRSCRAV